MMWWCEDDGDDDGVRGGGVVIVFMIMTVIVMMEREWRGTIRMTKNMAINRKHKLKTYHRKWNHHGKKSNVQPQSFFFFSPAVKNITLHCAFEFGFSFFLNCGFKRMEIKKRIITRFQDGFSNIRSCFVFLLNLIQCQL